MKLKKDGTISHQGEGGGQPMKYPTKELLENAVMRYFTKCLTPPTKIPTKAGLYYELDINKDTWSEYRKRYSDTIKRTELFIEDSWNQRLSEMGATGAIFYLKNAFKEDYKDRKETDVTSGGKPFKFLPDGIRNNNGNQENSSPEKEN